MKTESGSIRSEASTRSSPAVSHVHSVVSSERSSGCSPSRSKKMATVQMNEKSVAPAAIKPAV